MKSLVYFADEELEVSYSDTVTKSWNQRPKSGGHSLTAPPPSRPALMHAHILSQESQSSENKVQTR